MSEYIVTTEQLNWFLERMDEAVAIPAAIAHLKPIVRCRDCEKCNIGWCLHFSNIVKPDGFCAWGTPKNSDENITLELYFCQIKSAPFAPYNPRISAHAPLKAETKPCNAV